MVKLNTKAKAFIKTAWEVKSLSHRKSFIFTLTLLLLLPFALCFASLYISLPDNLYLVRGSTCTINTARLLSCDNAGYDSYASAGTASDAFVKEEDGSLELYTDSPGRYDAKLNFLGVVPIKTVSVEVIETGKVIPSGEVIGIKIHTDGVLLVKLATVEDEDGKIYAPAKDAGLTVGDVITKIDGKAVSDSDTFSKLVNETNGKGFDLEFVRDGETKKASVVPVLSDGVYKIGAWIRDSTAGIGTLTFINPASGSFASLGHGISDRDTGSLLSVGQGSITDCEISGVECGTKGTPGQLKGVLSNNDCGIIEKNSLVGVYGKYAGKPDATKAVEIASRFEIQPGAATIMSTVDDGGVKEYDIEIERVMTYSSDEKGMIIKVTDEELLEKTGGIVQGMSGSPIVQNGKLIGAVTHVFVNDPTRGYGIFIENMLAEAEKIK